MKYEQEDGRMIFRLIYNYKLMKIIIESMKFVSVVFSSLIGFSAAFLAPSSPSVSNQLTSTSSTNPAFGRKEIYIQGDSMIIHSDDKKFTWYNFNSGTGEYDEVATEDISGLGISGYTSRRIGKMHLSVDGSYVFVSVDMGASYGNSREFVVKYFKSGGYAGFTNSGTSGMYSDSTSALGFATNPKQLGGAICASPNGNTVLGTYYNGMHQWETSDGGSNWVRTTHGVDSNPAVLNGGSINQYGSKCHFLDNDNVLITAPASTYSGTQAGYMHVRTRDSGGTNAWGVTQEWTSNTNGMPVISGSAYFGDGFEFSPDGSQLAVSGRGSASIYLFSVSGATITYVETIVPDPVETEAPNNNLAYVDNIAWLDEKTMAISAYHTDISDTSSNEGRVIILHKAVNTWDIVQKIDGSAVNQYFGRVIASNPDEGLLLALAWNSVSGSTTVGSVHTFTLPECNTSPDCPTGEICNDLLECEAVPCTEHFDCQSSMQSGRLGKCVESVCVDDSAGSCSSVNDCINTINKAFATANSVGEKKVTYGSTDVNATEQAAKELIVQVRGDVADDSNVYAFVSGSSTAYLDRAYFDAHGGSQADALDDIKTVVCGDVPCEIEEVDSGNRRVLQEEGEVGVVITFDIDESLFDDLVANNEFDDPAFIAALAAEAGLSPDNITVNTAESTLEVTFIVATESSGDEPVDNAIVSELNAVSDSADSLAETVATNLGLASEDVAVNTIDLCGDRNCNGRGTCDSETGICDCTDLNYWGINCETPVTCTDGQGTPVGQYCQCDYPYTGLRCENTKDACSDGTCA